MVNIRACDKCGKQIGGYKFKLLSLSVVEIPYYLIPRNDTYTFELCDKCLKEYNSLLEDWICR